MDTALVEDGVIVQVWRDCDIGMAEAAGAPDGAELIEFPPDVAVCGMLWDDETLISPAPPLSKRLIAKSLVQARLIEAGKLDAVFALLLGNPESFAKWFAPDWPKVFADDPAMLDVLAVAGADVEAITAP